MAEGLIRGEQDGIALTVAEKNLLQERADRLHDIMEKQLTGKLPAPDELEEPVR